MIDFISLLLILNILLYVPKKISYKFNKTKTNLKNL